MRCRIMESATSTCRPRLTAFGAPSRTHAAKTGEMTHVLSARVSFSRIALRLIFAHQRNHLHSEQVRSEGSTMGVRHRAACAGIIVVVLSTIAPLATDAQESVEQFYKGKQINLVIGTSPGGGYDTYGRLVARRLGNYIPGNPAIVPQNMPGAGSNKAAGYIYSVAPKDGTTIGAIFSGAILQPLLGEPAGQHDPSKFIYVGNANNEVFLCLARSDAPVKSFADVLHQELIVGASSEGGSTRDFPALLNNVL